MFLENWQDLSCHLQPAEALLLESLVFADWKLPELVWYCLMDLLLGHLQPMQQLLPVLVAADANAGDALIAVTPGAVACPAVDAAPTNHAHCCLTA